MLRLLARAGVAVTEADRARFEACADAATLDARWVDNVFGAKTAADVLSLIACAGGIVHGAAG